MGVRMSEKLELRKGGKLVETKWVYDKQAKKGEYKEFDRTANGLRHLFDTCVLAPDVTLRIGFFCAGKLPMATFSGISLR